MAILVFGNVVLRYLFNSGITWSEEMARFLFIWLVLFGSVIALKQNEHLGVDMLVKRLSKPLKTVIYIISNLLVLAVLYLVVEGSWKMTVLNGESTAPATGLPLTTMYFPGVIMGIGMAVIILLNLYRLLFRKANIDELTRTQESEEMMSNANAGTGVDQGVPR
ncbi:TRAP transporter small permease [Paenibacillus xerothermodurans]|uniref:TRAP transporter small permease n=2 Tax=Paenibacillus xerothermodurans TaxID=1977292 RepID=A0A2W1N7Q0_PAEXE|nr:TRAP transporter small permease [Paenibacillus xerothermodurans]